MKMKSIIRFNIIYSALLLSLCALLSVSCSNPPVVAGSGSTFEVSGFKPVCNFDSLRVSEGKLVFYIDYSDALEGFTIPSVKQSPEQLQYVFKIRNTGPAAQRFRYKLYYQNESYKFAEILNHDSSFQHPQCQENFYGSWANAEGFRATAAIPADGEFHEVTGFFNVQGNPREEKKYFLGDVNQRWQRNPRMGKYSFLLVVMPENIPSQSPELKHCGDFSLMPDSTFMNPYYYFIFGEGRTLKDVAVIRSADTLVAVSNLPMDGGIYIDPVNFEGEKNALHFSKNCGQNEELRRRAPFKQFVHYVDSSSSYYNIPVVADVTGDDYTFAEYNWNRAFCAEEEYVHIQPAVADCPCDEVITDTIKHSILLVNKATEWGRWEKQNVGIITRNGLSYGTYTVKVRMPELLNNYGVWNGLTNAIWLITQSPEPWNSRRTCEKKGYLGDYYGPDKKRVPNTSYSEIDFEILKTGPYCPDYVYAPGPLKPAADQQHRAWWDIPYPGNGPLPKDQVMVCCTNWDMACPDPEDFGVGCQDLKYQDLSFLNHRWDDWYNAVTSKFTVSDDELFGGQYYYFQITWKPEEIIWKIGPEKNKLRTVGYMNSGMSSIPNNQMLLIISQEFHATGWWPGSPFDQGHIPFPAKPLVGEVLEITIE